MDFLVFLLIVCASRSASNARFLFFPMLAFGGAVSISKSSGLLKTSSSWSEIVSMKSLSVAMEGSTGDFMKQALVSVRTM